jgi:hypothetical protein
VWNGVTTEVGYVHSAPGQVWAAGGFLSAAGQRISTSGIENCANTFAGIGVAASGIVEVAPADWTHFKFLFGGTVGVPVHSSSGWFALSQSYATLVAGGVVRL